MRALFPKAFQMRKLKLRWLKSRRQQCWGSFMGIQALMGNEKITGHCVIPGTSIFKDIQRFRVGQHNSLLCNVSPSQFPDKKKKGQKIKAVTSVLIIDKSGFFDSYSILYPSTFSPYPLEKEPSKWSCPHPSHSQKLLFWAIIHRPSSAAASCEHLPGGKIPRARSRRERATTCMFCCVWLISNEYSNASYVPGQLSNILQWALNGYAPHKKMEWEWIWSDGVDKQVKL